MQEHYVEIGEVLVVAGVRFRVLAIVGGEVYLGVGDPQQAPGEISPAQLGLTLETWLDRSPN